MKKQSSILQLQILLATLMNGKFENNTIEFNKKLNTQLNSLKGIIFDRKQMWGNPNYEPVPLEKELKAISTIVYDTILDQELTTDMSKFTSMELMQRYEDMDWSRSSTPKQSSVSTKIRTELMLRAKAVLGENPGEPEIKQMAILARFVNNRSNCGHPEHLESVQLLDQYKQPDFMRGKPEDLACLTI